MKQPPQHIHPYTHNNDVWSDPNELQHKLAGISDYDASTTMELLNNNAHLVHELQQLFMAEFTQQCHMLQQHIHQQDFQSIQAICHKIQGSTAYLRFNKINMLAQLMHKHAAAEQIDPVQYIIHTLKQQQPVIQSIIVPHDHP